MEEKFLMDIHVHTCDVSACARVSAKEAVRLYWRAGYQGIMISDHFFNLYFERLGTVSWKEKVDHFLTGYRNAKLEGDRIGLSVSLGMEFRNEESENDFLIIGLTEEFLYAHPDIYRLPLTEAIELFHDHGMLIIQAHPERFGMVGVKEGHVSLDYTASQMLELIRSAPDTREIHVNEGRELKRRDAAEEVREPLVLRVCHLQCEDILDGIEVYNGNKHWAQDPEVIKKHLERHPGYLRTSGSDFHEPAQLGAGGMVFDKAICNSLELKAALLEKEVLGWLIDGNCLTFT